MEENMIKNEQALEVNAVETSESAIENGVSELNQEIPRLEEGSIVNGRVVLVEEDVAFVDVGWKSELQIPLAELSEEKLSSAHDILKVGDEIKAMVLKSEEDDKPLLSKRRADQVVAWSKLEDDFKNHQRVKGEIIQAVKGGLRVKVYGITVFLPASQADLGFVRDLNTLVGIESEFYIIDFEPERRRAILSRKEVLAEDYKKIEDQVYSEIKEGETRSGVITRLVPFGAFVDLGQGVEGLLHISEISWERLQHPSEQLKEGQEIEVLVIKVDHEARRISLSLKQLSPHPWAKAEEKYKVDEIVEGKVVRLTSFGAFVNLEPGIDGLIHISQLSNKRVEKPEDVVKVGEMVKVKIIKVEPEQKRIGLSLRDAQEQESFSSEEERDSIPGIDNTPLSSNLGELLAEKMGLDKKE